MEDIFYTSADGKTEIHAVLFKPEGEVKGVVQIIHGMAEYAARYAPFAEFLNKNGYVVCGEDHLGHGKSVAEEGCLGWFNSERDYKIVLKDINSLRQKIQPQFAGKPYFVLGHSMGSFFCRNYIAEYGEGLSGAIVMGTGYKSPLITCAALALTNLNALFFGWKNRSKFIKNVAFGSYNKKFKEEQNDKSWLSVSKENIAAYRADEFCGFDFTDNGYIVLFSVIKAACSKKCIKKVDKSLPVYFVSGCDDPVGDNGKGVIKAYKKFKAAGVQKVDITLYEGYRHEILNDDCKDRVRADILSFIESNTATR